MPAGAVNLRYLILGLLAQQPMSGYDIKRLFKSLDWLIGSPSGGSLYPILRALLKEKLVAVEIVPGVDRPPRKIYNVQEAGQQALRAWASQQVVSDTPLKGFVMRLLLADVFPPNGLTAQLQKRHRQVTDQVAVLGKMARARDHATGLGQSLALDYGLALAAAELAWLDSVLGTWPRLPLSEEDKLTEGELLID